MVQGGVLPRPVRRAGTPLVFFHAYLGHRRPVDVLRDERPSGVVLEIEAEQGGAFA